MKKYILLICDGNGAASRGMDDDTLYTFECEANDLDDAINKCEKEIRDIDRFDYWDEVDSEYDSYADYFNSKDSSGGDIFLVAHFEDNKLIEDTYLEEWRKTGCYKFDDPKMAAKFGMEEEAGDYRQEYMKDILDQIKKHYDEKDKN